MTAQAAHSGTLESPVPSVRDILLVSPKAADLLREGRGDNWLKNASPSVLAPIHLHPVGRLSLTGWGLQEDKRVQ